MTQTQNSSVYTKPSVPGLRCTVNRRMSLEVWSSSTLVARKFYVKETWQQPGRWGKSHSIFFEYVHAHPSDGDSMFIVVNEEPVNTAFENAHMTEYFGHEADPCCSVGVWVHMVRRDRTSPIPLIVQPVPGEQAYGANCTQTLRVLALEAAGLIAPPLPWQ